MAKQTINKSHNRVRFLRRHKGFMPGDESNYPGGVAKTLVQIGAAEFVIRKGVKVDGKPKTPAKPAEQPAEATEPAAPAESTEPAAEMTDPVEDAGPVFTDLPEGTREALAAAGITTIQDLREYPGSFTDIDGIGPGRAKKITALLTS